MSYPYEKPTYGNGSRVEGISLRVIREGSYLNKHYLKQRISKKKTDEEEGEKSPKKNLAINEVEQIKNYLLKEKEILNGILVTTELKILKERKKRRKTED